MLERFGSEAVLVRETPAALGEADVKGLVRDLADDLAEHGLALALKERLEDVAATMACHGSVRARPAVLARRRWMRSCAKWKPRPAPASAITAARPMSNSSSRT